MRNCSGKMSLLNPVSVFSQNSPTIMKCNQWLLFYFRIAKGSLSFQCSGFESSVALNYMHMCTLTLSPSEASFALERRQIRDWSHHPRAPFSPFTLFFPFPTFHSFFNEGALAEEKGTYNKLKLPLHVEAFS